LPGFRLALGFTLKYLLVIVVAPLSTIFFKSVTLTWQEFWATIAAPRTLAAWLSFVASFVAALVNSVFGKLVAWTLVRYEVPARGVIDAMVDLPFALPTSDCCGPDLCRPAVCGANLQPVLEHYRRARNSKRWDGAVFRARCSFAERARSQDRLGVPALRPFPPHDGLRERGVRGCACCRARRDRQKAR